jgi:signal transduction histidine kinase
MVAWIKRIEKSSKAAAVAMSIGLVILVGLGDYLTGYEAFFFIFYLIPIFLAMWCVGVSFAVLVSALSVAAWRVSNFIAGAHYSSSLISAWNIAVVFVLYLVVVGLLKLYKELDELVRQRTSALTREMQERRRLEKELLETTEREQRRIGHDLHDNLCQHLTATAFAGQLLGQKLTKKSLPEAAAANHLVELVEEAIELTRALARSLHPVEMEAEGIFEGFRELAASITERFKISCRFECHPPTARLQLDTGTSIHLYRITQEAISNAIKHGKAKHVTIRIEIESNATSLTVTDDGVGLSQNRQDGQGMGLRIMAYRASMIGATFKIERLPAYGTRVTCKLSPATATHPTIHASKK